MFALLTKGSFALYEDMHMAKPPLIEFPYSSLTFVDMGMSIQSETKSEKFYFIKMVSESVMRREVHLMAIAHENIQKWEYCLNLQKDADFQDNFYTTVSLSLLKKILQSTIRNQALEQQKLTQLEVIVE